VRCDVDRVGQILTNLIGNAIKFTEVGQVQVSAEALDGLVAVHITDTGVGIPAAAKAKVFEEFFQVDQSMARRQRGTGLGLAIASRLAHLMGGDITLESVVGAGSRFTLTLPRSLDQADALRAELARGEAPVPLDGRVVLVIDENEGDRQQAAAVLAGLGVRVEAPSSADKGLALLRRGAPRFDAVVVDPFSSALAATEEIAADPQLARIPLIVLHAHDLSVRDRDRLAPAAFGFVRKSDTLAVALPAMLAKAVHAPAPTALSAPPPARDTAILIVEDNEDNLFTLRQILAVLSVDLVTAASGREAIEYCRRRLPDMILMDMQMPGMSGLQATGAIRSLPGGPTIPIIALTAQAMKGDRERILAAGCDEYLSKPIQPKVLLGLVKGLLSRRQPGDGDGDGNHIDGRGNTGTGEEDRHGAHTAGR
jgi:CheY-like chemotaxis protein/anti-sigma regulatory factor (Ser/Thr protein kinase)